MTKVISISTDRGIFEEGSAVRARQIEYGSLFGELHIIVFTKLSSFLPTKIQIAPNVWVYGTHSLSKMLHVSQAVKIAGRIIEDQKMTSGNTVITVQNPFETGLVGLKIKRKFHLPLHVQIHTDFLSSYFARESLLNRLRVKIAKKVLPKADAIRVVSQRIVDSMSKVKVKPEVTPFVLPVFVDVEKIEQKQVELNLKEKYPQFNFLVLVASRLTKEKNVHFAIEILKDLLKFYPKTGLVVVGSGPEEKRLKSLVRKLGIVESVVFEPWQNDLVSYYKTANLFMLTSNYEGYGMSLVEAIASHCPTVSTNVGIAPKLLRDGEVNFVCPIGDKNCFLDKITMLIENVSLRERFIHEAYDRLDEVIVKNKREYLMSYRTNIEAASNSSGLS